tara:strand:- start:4497 stop:5651 length:1155 start_codon:yes stop_codon:yes gene_type:complete
MFHKLVDKVYAINLPSSKDRRANILHQCRGVGTHFEIVDAIDGRKDNVDWVENEVNSHEDGWTQGAAGLVHTTKNIIKDAKEKGYKSIMIMEDDIVFIPDAYRIAKGLFDTLPEDWELFHLASQDYSNNSRRLGGLLRLGGAWSCQIYMIHERVFDEYLEWLELVDRPIDSVTSQIIHPKGNSYAPITDLIKTLPNYSTIRGKDMNYGINTESKVVPPSVPEIEVNKSELVVEAEVESTLEKKDDIVGLTYQEVYDLLNKTINDLVSSGSTIFSKEEVIINSQTVASEDNNIELNYDGTKDSALNGGIFVNKGIDDDTNSEFLIDSDGDWVTNNYIKPYGLTIPEYTPTSSLDSKGELGEMVRDNDYIYIKTMGGWKRSNLEKF